MGLGLVSLSNTYDQSLKNSIGHSLRDLRTWAQKQGAIKYLSPRNKDNLEESAHGSELCSQYLLALIRSK